MIKVTYTISEERELFIADDKAEALSIAQKAVDAFEHGDKTVKILEVKVCICAHCGKSISMSRDSFICEPCNSR